MVVLHAQDRTDEGSALGIPEPLQRLGLRLAKAEALRLEGDTKEINEVMHAVLASLPPDTLRQLQANVESGDRGFARQRWWCSRPRTRPSACHRAMC